MLKSFGTILRATSVGALLATSVLPAAALNLPFGIGADRERPAAQSQNLSERPVQMAQVGDAGSRISQLEEENRRLNGKLEELSFQVLQMQEQMRKAQEDNDFRFQELEGKGGARPASTGTAPPPARRSDAAPAGEDQSVAGAAPGDEIGTLLGEGSGLNTGSIPAGAPTGGGAGQGGAAAVPPKSGTVASVRAGSAGELYALAYNYLLAGDYQLAETSFRQYTQAYPEAKDVPDARYWLGESQYQQSKYTDAAETFLNAQKDYPKSPKAPEMMLKLGMSLAKLDNRDTACVTFKEVARRYPQMNATVKRKLQTESQAAKCAV